MLLQQRTPHTMSSAPNRHRDLTSMWRALEANAALIEQLVRPIVHPTADPTIDELTRTVAGEHGMPSERSCISQVRWLPCIFNSVGGSLAKAT